MSFTVQEARAAFLCCTDLTPHHVGGSNFSKIACANSDGAQVLVTSAT
jgi:hypothetical protein